MKITGYTLSLMSLLLVLPGCSLIPGMSNGREAIRKIEQTISSTGKALQPSVVLVSVEGGSRKQSSKIKMIGGKMVRERAGASTLYTAGIVLDKKGHILVSEMLNPDSVGNIKVWLDDEEYPAKIIKNDNNLKMTILKINTNEELSPLAFTPHSELKPGYYSISIEPRGENEDFEKLFRVNICSGVLDGFYRKYKNNYNISRTKGSPAVDLDGKLVGIQLGNDIIAMKDIYPDLKDFIKEATGHGKNKKKPEKKSWLGASLYPINKQYAILMNLPKSGIWVNKVYADSPGKAAGLQEGDLVVGVNGRKLRFSGSRSLSLFNKILRPEVKKPFSIEVIRNKKNLVLKSKFTEKPQTDTLCADDLGITVKEITDHDSFAYNLFAPNGVLVTNVKRGSPAANSGQMSKSLLGRNYVITELGGMPTPDLESFTKALEKIRLEKPEVLLVRYWRGRTTGFAGLNLKIGDQGNGAE